MKIELTGKTRVNMTRQCRIESAMDILKSIRKKIGTKQPLTSVERPLLEISLNYGVLSGAKKAVKQGLI